MVGAPKHGDCGQDNIDDTGLDGEVGWLVIGWLIVGLGDVEDAGLGVKGRVGSGSPVDSAAGLQGSRFLVNGGLMVKAMVMM